MYPAVASGRVVEPARADAQRWAVPSAPPNAPAGSVAIGRDRPESRRSPPTGPRMPHSYATSSTPANPHHYELRAHGCRKTTRVAVRRREETRRLGDHDRGRGAGEQVGERLVLLLAGGDDRV